MNKSSNIALYLLLSVLACIGFGYYAVGVVGFYQKTVHASRYSRLPFGRGERGGDGRTVSYVSAEAKAGGLRVGDVVETVDGRPFTGFFQLYKAVRTTPPGETLAVGVRERSGATRTILIRLRQIKSPGHSVKTVLGFYLPALAIPLFGLLVGTWVAAVRIRDLNAWLVFLLLLFSEAVFGNLDWKFWLPLWPLFWFWKNFVFIAAGVALLWFGFLFPERWRLDVRIPWLKYLVLGTAVVCFALILWNSYAQYYFEGSARFSDGFGNAALWTVNRLLAVCAILFLIALFDKLFSGSTPDARRRVRVLALGSALSVGPFLVIFAFDPMFAANPGHLSILMVIVALFPLTLAYVVIVERAMDVRVLVRAGTRYLLARTGIWVAQVVLLSAAAYILLAPRQYGAMTGMSRNVGLAVFVGLLLLLRFVARKRVREWLDRKFFREAYNAEQVMTELSEEVRRFTDPHPLLETVARRISDTLHVENIALLLRNGKSFQLQQAIGLPVDGQIVLAAHSSAVRQLTMIKSPARLYRKDPDPWYLMADPSERRVIDELKAELLLPIRGREKLMGVMALGPKLSEAAYSRSDLHLLQTVASQAGLALEVSELAHSLAQEAAQRERTQREIEIAREVQQRLFPQEMPVLPGATLAGFCRPALGVGGDYYDVFALNDGRVGLAIGDVSGKGISAALLMASLRASLRGLMLADHVDFGRLMEQMNRLVYEASESHRYATFFFGAYDPKTRVLECVNAGHNPPLVMRGEEAIFVEAGGPVVGLLPAAKYSSEQVQLSAGDILVLYTDGVSEAMTAQEEEWGEERLIQAVRAANGPSATDTLRRIFEDNDAFTAGAKQHDDMTLLVLKCEAAG